MRFAKGARWAWGAVLLTAAWWGGSSCVLERGGRAGGDGVWSSCEELEAPGATPRPGDPCDPEGVRQCCVADCLCSEWVERYECEDGQLRRRAIARDEDASTVATWCGTTAPPPARCPGCPGF